MKERFVMGGAVEGEGEAGDPVEEISTMQREQSLSIYRATIDSRNQVCWREIAFSCLSNNSTYSN